MINIDLSKAAPSLRLLIYLLSMIPGLFFLVSVALGDPVLAGKVIKEVGSIYPVPPYVALCLSLGSALVIGHTFVLLAWMLEMILISLFRMLKPAFRRLFGAKWLYEWHGRNQGIPPKQTPFFRILGTLIRVARAPRFDHPDAVRVRACLGAAVEKLLERRYGIPVTRAGGLNGEWGIWYSVLGKLPKGYRENLNAGRVLLASGLAGCCAITIASGLLQRYFVTMCAVFAICGLWTAVSNVLTFRNPVNLDLFRLRAVLLELQDLSPEVHSNDEPQ